MKILLHACKELSPLVMERASNVTMKPRTTSGCKPWDA
jgi:hypothetical protein